MARSTSRLALIGAGLLSGLLWGLVAQARAAEIYADDTVQVRWDNMLRYSLALRPLSRSAELLSYINGDDGDRNFAPGLVSNRLDLVSKLDITAGDFGIHASAAAWVDTVYHDRTDNPSPATDNSAASPGHFAPALRNLYGQHAELDDAFVYANIAVAEMPLSLRAGRQTLLWGESRFFDANSIAAAMAPTDYLKQMTDQGGYSAGMFLPVTQVNATIQPLPWLSLSLYDQIEWRPSREPGDGSFLSYVDYTGTGAARLFLTPNRYLTFNPDRGPASGQYGLSLHASIADTDLGFYALRFRAKDPIVAQAPDPALASQTGAVGTYRLFHPPAIELYGASVSTEWDGKVFAGEISTRQNAPLVSYDPRIPQYYAPTRTPYYARGDTLHIQASAMTGLAATPLWDQADATLEFASDHILRFNGPAAGAPYYSYSALKARARLEPHYFQVLPNLDLTGVAELGFNLAGHSFSYYTQNSGTGDFRLGVTGTWLSTWRANLSYVGFLGAPSRQPLADRDFLMLSLERTF